MKIRNLTPHNVIIIDDDKNVIAEFKPEFQVRVKEVISAKFKIDNIPVVVKQYRRAENLPNEEKGTVLIVSKMVFDAHPDRNDLYCPDTGPDSVVRNKEGNIIGVKRLQK